MKQTIAIDIDEVLADSALAFRLHAKEHAGLDLDEEQFKIPGPYWLYYESIFLRHGIEDKDKQKAVHAVLDENPHLTPPVEGAIEALKKLSEHYKIVLITARDPKLKGKTELWLQRHFDGLYHDLHLLGNFKIVDNPKTKGQAAQEVGASWLIDDNPEHCQSAFDHGVTPLLFGDFGWQHDAPNDLQRCKTWEDVLRYFDAKQR